jgi:hypothetical protein
VYPGVRAVVAAVILGLCAPATAWGLAGFAPAPYDSLAEDAKKKKKKKKKCKKKKCKKARPPASKPADTPVPLVPKPAPEVFAVENSEVVELPDAGDPTLVLSGERLMAPGQFVTAEPGPGMPMGFLLKVTSSTAQGGQTEVETEPGALFDAVPTGELNVDLGDARTARPLNGDARLLSNAMRSVGDSAPFDELIDCSGDTEMELTGELTTELQPDIDLEWTSYLGVPTRIDLASVDLAASISAEALAEISAEGSCELETITLFEPEWQVFVPVGPVRVPVRVEIPFNVDAEASASGSASVSALASVSGSLGYEYRGGGFAPVRSFGWNADLGFDVTADASIEVSVGPEASITAGWSIPFLGKLAASLGASAKSGLDLSYDINATPPAEMCVPLTVGASATFFIPGFEDLVAGPATIFDDDLKCIGTGLHWTGTIDAEYSTEATREHGPGPEDYEEWTFSGESDWEIDSWTGEGMSEFPLAYDNEWSSERTYSNGCLPPINPPYVRGGYTVSGSGSGGRSEEDLATFAGRDWTGFIPSSSRFFLGVPNGTHDVDVTDCAGGGNDFSQAGVVDCLPASVTGPVPLPRTGTEVDLTLSSDQPCFGGPGVEADGGWTVDIDLTVTCPGGAPPNAEWRCP